MTLEQLAVVSAPQITFDPKYPDRITVEFTPTVPHCGMSTFIGKNMTPPHCAIGSNSMLNTVMPFRVVHPCAAPPESPATLQD